MDPNQESKKPDEEKEVTKAEFKELYFKYATPESGWTEENWNHNFEKEEGARYFFTPPATPKSTSMFISSGQHENRIYFLTEESEESFFDFPGKD